MPSHWRFRRSFKVGPGLRLNLNRRSVSVTAGSRRGGPHTTISSNEIVTTSAGLPGTGLSYRWTSRLRGKVRGHSIYWPVVTLLVLGYVVWMVVR
jgi:hypothetical protein